MKTNQLMEVRLGKYGLIHAKHLTAMLNLNDILVVGNDVRKSKGLGEKKLSTFLRRKDTWEYVLKVFNSEVEDEYSVLNREKNSDKSSSPIGTNIFEHLNDFPTTKSDGKIQYSEIEMGFVRTYGDLKDTIERLS
jgi:hypothetical protein